MAAAEKITVIGTRLAKPGESFFFMDEKEECKKCKIRGTCLNLESGRKYRVVSVRNTPRLNCALHDGGVLPIVVENAPTEAYIDSKKAVAGTKITYAPTKFENETEDADTEKRVNAELFAPKGLFKGDKCLVQEVFEDVERDGKTYKRVSLVLE